MCWRRWRCNVPICSAQSMSSPLGRLCDAVSTVHCLIYSAQSMYGCGGCTPVDVSYAAGLHVHCLRDRHSQRRCNNRASSARPQRLCTPLPQLRCSRLFGRFLSLVRAAGSPRCSCRALALPQLSSAQLTQAYAGHASQPSEAHPLGLCRRACCRTPRPQCSRGTPCGAQ